MHTMANTSWESLELKESYIVEDAYAPPSDIAWRIEEISYMKQATAESCPDEQEYYAQWLSFNIKHLLDVEGGGI